MTQKLTYEIGTDREFSSKVTRKEKREHDLNFQYVIEEEGIGTSKEEYY